MAHPDMNQLSIIPNRDEQALYEAWRADALAYEARIGTKPVDRAGRPPASVEAIMRAVRARKEMTTDDIVMNINTRQRIRVSRDTVANTLTRLRKTGRVESDLVDGLVLWREGKCGDLFEEDENE